MDIDDFIFTEDVAESLGSRGEAADLDRRSAETGEESPLGSCKTGFVLAGVGLGILSIMGLLDRDTQL